MYPVPGWITVQKLQYLWETALPPEIQRRHFSVLLQRDSMSCALELPGKLSITAKV